MEASNTLYVSVTAVSLMNISVVKLTRWGGGISEDKGSKPDDVGEN